MGLLKKLTPRGFTPRRSRAAKEDQHTPKSSITRTANAVIGSVAATSAKVAIGGASAVGKVLSTSVQITTDAVNLGVSSITGTPLRGVVPRASDESVEARTAEENFFTAAAGWPASAQWAYGWPSPPSLMAAGAGASPDGGTPIGELRVEVLEAELAKLHGNEKGGDLLSPPDPYAVVLFEGLAARTHQFVDERRPRWGDASARAFRLPIRRPYSQVCVCIKDSDTDHPEGGSSADDEDIGRIVLNVGSLVSDTVYDGWFALEHGADRMPSDRGARGARGYVRLRVSVSFISERARMLHYLRAPTAFEVPLVSASCRKSVAYAHRGLEEEKEYQTHICKANVVEVLEVLEELIELSSPVLDVVLWRNAKVSGAALALWQLLAFVPQFLPAVVPLLGLAALRAKLSASPPDSPLYVQPSVLSLALILLVGRRIGGAIGRGLGLDGIAGEPFWYSPPDAEGVPGVVRRPRIPTRLVSGILNARPSLSEAQAATAVQCVQRGRVARRRVAIAPRKVSPTRATIIDEQASWVEARVEAAEQTSEAGQRKVADVLKGTGSYARYVSSLTFSAAAAADPLAVIFTPVQHVLTVVLVPIRFTRRVLRGDDRALTTLLAVLLAGCTLVLALLPLLFSWQTVFVLAFRALGILLLGPQNPMLLRYLHAAIESRQAEGEQRAKAKASNSVLHVRSLPLFPFLRSRFKPDPRFSRAYPLVKTTDAQRATVRTTSFVDPRRAVHEWCEIGRDAEGEVRRLAPAAYELYEAALALMRWWLGKRGRGCWVLYQDDLALETDFGID